MKLLYKYFCFGLIFLGSIASISAQSFISDNSLSALEATYPVVNGKKIVWGDQPVGKILAKILKEKKLPFDFETIRLVTQVLKNNEYNLALAILNNLPPIAKDKFSKEQKFALQELHQYLLVQVNFQLENYKSVATEAKSYVQKYGNGEHFTQAYYYFAVSLHHLDRPLELTSLVTEDFYEKLPKGRGYQLRKILSQNALRQNDPLSAFDFITAGDGQLIYGYSTWIQEIISTFNSIDDLEELEEDIKNPYLKSTLKLKKVELLVKKGFFDKADSILQASLSKSSSQSGGVDAAIYSRLQKLKEFLELTKKTNPYKIGVLLPLSHPRVGRLAKQVQRGLELALKDFKINKKSVELIFRDTKLNEKFTKKATIDLIRQENVIAILGPLARNTTLAAAKETEKYRVPLISFSIVENIGKISPFLFRFQRNHLLEAKAIAHYAFDYLGARRFILFYPSYSRKGFQKMEAFWSQIIKKGGTVVGIETISKKQVDFDNAFKRITGGFRKITAKEKEEIRLARSRLEPVIDFDAIYAPTRIIDVRYIASFARVYDSEKVWILGGSELNHSQNFLLKSVARLRFADTFSVGQSDTALQPFFEKHWKFYNHQKYYQKPTVYTLYGYEALQVLTSLLNDPKNHNREALREAIQKLDKVKVLSGNITALENGELVKNVQILKMYKGQTTKVFR